MTPARRLYCGLFGLVSILAVNAPAASAQSGAERSFFDQLLLDFNKIDNPGQVPSTARCAAVTGAASRLCEGLLITRKAEFTKDWTEINKARELLERTVDEQKQWPVAWYALGMLRFELARAKGLSREGPLQPLGTSSEYGGGLALIRAVTLDSNFTPAIEALSMAALPREGPPKYGERLDAIRALRSKLSGMGKYGAGLIEFEAGNTDESISWFKEALRDPKVDKGMIRLAMARALYKSGNSTDGRVVLIAGANDTSVASRHAYRRMLGFVASPKELAEWDSLKVGDHSVWFTRFWSTRDINEGLRDGSRLTEHFKRFEYAIKWYQLKEVQMGQQTTSSQAKKVDIANDAVSARYFADLRLKILAEAADTVESTSMMVAAAIAQNTYQTPFRAVRALRDKLDDRGIVYVRYGAPDVKEEVADEGGAALWVYNLPDGPMFVAFRAEEFTGNAGATRLVPHLADLPAITRNKFCNIRPTLCSAVSGQDIITAGQNQGVGFNNTRVTGGGTTALADMGDGNPVLRREAEEGVRNIERVTTTDAFARTFPKVMKPSVQVVSLDRLAGGNAHVVVAFAIPGSQLIYTTPPEAGGRAVYAVRIQLLLSREYDGKRIEVDTVRAFAHEKPFAPTEYLSSVAEFSLPPGAYAGSVILSQDGGGGAIARLARTVVPEEGPGLAVSDLVLGRPGGVAWNSGTMVVPLNPFNTYTKGSEANAYVQLRGLTKGETYDLTYEFFKGDETVKAIALTFKETATADRMELPKALSFPNLEPGYYRLRLTVTGGGKSVTTTSGLSVVKP